MLHASHSYLHDANARHCIIAFVTTCTPNGPATRSCSHHQHVALGQTGRGGDTNSLHRYRSNIHTLYTSSLYVLLPSAIDAVRPVFAVLKNRSTSTVKNGKNFCFTVRAYFPPLPVSPLVVFFGRSSQCRRHVQPTCEWPSTGTRYVSYVVTDSVWTLARVALRGHLLTVYISTLHCS